MIPVIMAAAATVVTNLSAVVVEASRLGSAPMDMPSAVHLVDRSEIAASGARDAVDLVLKRLPEISVCRLGADNPAMAEFAMRGYGEYGYGRTLVLIDGDRLNSPDMNAPNLARIASDAVEKIEVLSGSQQVLHGDGASAGVVNVVTEPQDDRQRSHVELRVGSWGAAGASSGTRGGLPDEGLRYWTDASWLRSDGYRRHSAYSLWNVGAGLRKRWDGGAFLRLTSFWNDSQYDLPGALSADEWRRDPRASHAAEDRCRRISYGVGFTAMTQFSDERALRLSVAFSRRTMAAYQQGGDVASVWTSDLDYLVNAYRSQVEWIDTDDLFSFDSELVLGVQHAYDILDGQSEYSGESSEYRYGRQALDCFAQEKLQLTECLAAQAGGRFSRAWSRNSLATPEFRADGTWAFDLSLLYQPTEAAKLHVKASKTYRRPFLDEVPYDVRTWKPGALLAPERGWTVETGGRWEIMAGLALEADAYCSWLENEIFYDAGCGNNVNSDGWTLRRGADLRLSWERDKLAGFSLGASFVKATFADGTYEGCDIPLVPNVTVAANVRIWLWDDGTIFGGYRFRSSAWSCSDIGNDCERLDWNGVFHLGMTWEPQGMRWLEGVRVTVSVDNLFDERYCDYSTYGTNCYPGPGRCLSLVIRYGF